MSNHVLSYLLQAEVMLLVGLCIPLMGRFLHRQVNYIYSVAMTGAFAVAVAVCEHYDTVRRLILLVGLLFVLATQFMGIREIGRRDITKRHRA